MNFVELDSSCKQGIVALPFCNMDSISKPNSKHQLIEDMSSQQLNKCLQKFYLSARKQGGNFYTRNRLSQLSGPRLIDTKEVHH